jgi:hypothetical protein
VSSPLDSSAALLLTVVLSHINIKTFNTIEVAPGSPPFIIAAIAFDKAEGEDDEGLDSDIMEPAGLKLRYCGDEIRSIVVLFDFKVQKVYQQHQGFI